jgi:hypothetical protein
MILGNAAAREPHMILKTYHLSHRRQRVAVHRRAAPSRKDRPKTLVQPELMWTAATRAANAVRFYLQAGPAWDLCSTWPSITSATGSVA